MIKWVSWIPVMTIKWLFWFLPRAALGLYVHTTVLSAFDFYMLWIDIGIYLNWCNYSQLSNEPMATLKNMQKRCHKKSKQKKVHGKVQQWKKLSNIEIDPNTSQLQAIVFKLIIKPMHRLNRWLFIAVCMRLKERMWASFCSTPLHSVRC